MKVNKRTIWNIFSTVISIILCVAIGISLLMGTMTKKQREYLASDDLKTQIENTKLNDIKFIMDGKKITLVDYLANKVEEYVEKKLPELSKFSGYAVEKILSSDRVTQSIHKYLIELLDYILYADVEEAKMRVENNVSIRDNQEFAPEEARNIDDFVDRVVKTVTLECVEDISEMDIDNIIVTLSEENAQKYETIAIILFVVLILINIIKFENIFLYSAMALTVTGIGIKIVQNQHASLLEGGEDLATYVFVKPYIDMLTGNSNTMLLIAFALLAVFLFLALFSNRIKELIMGYIKKDKTA